MFLPLILVVLARGGLDEALFRRISAGDTGALRKLYDRVAPLALAIAIRILHSRGEAEEVVQEVFVEAWRRAGNYDARRGTAVSFVLAIARSRALDRLRAQDSAGRATQALSREESSPVPLPIESAEQRQQRERISGALASLPQEQKAVIELAYFEGLTQAEIAARTGEPLGTVKTRCRLALEKLALLFAGERP